MSLAGRSLQLLGLATLMLVAIYWSDIVVLWKNRENLSKVQQLVQAYQAGVGQ